MAIELTEFLKEGEISGLYAEEFVHGTLRKLLISVLTSIGSTGIPGFS